MKPEDQVCNLEQSLQIEGCDVELATVLCWVLPDGSHFDSEDWELHFLPILEIREKWNKEGLEIVPAPTIAELIDILPPECLIEDYLCDLVIIKYDDGCFCVEYRQIRTDGKDTEMYSFENSLNKALADCLIWLLENKYLKPEDIKL